MLSPGDLIFGRCVLKLVCFVVQGVIQAASLLLQTVQFSRLGVGFGGAHEVSLFLLLLLGR